MSVFSRLLDWLRPPQATSLVWHCQHASFAPIIGNPLLHYARTDAGTFEIYEEGESFLLHFPRGMNLPAEIFYSLAVAKDRAALIDGEAK